MARRTKKPKLSDLPGQSDPRAALDGATFLAASQPVLKVLEDDLVARAKGSPPVLAALQKRHADERSRERTAEGFDGWLDALVTQVAAAWLLSCVFVRVLEDRGLIEQARIAGPGATDSQKQFFALAPSLTEREYLLTVFRELSRLPGVAGIFDARQNPVWKLAPSAEATKSLLELFRLPDAEAPAFRFGQGDTRVLGDLYQDLSEAVRKRYALLQTPRFVESFILDRTLERAIERFGLDETDLIDPTCGSGHFLLGAFERLFDHRMRSQGGLDVREAARLALDAVYGADINPYAVAIARFRLTLAFIEKAGYRSLADVPELPLHVVVADSLLHNPYAQNQGDFKDLEGQSAAVWAGAEFALEDEEAAREVLYRKYAAVVGNPPYITVKDKALRRGYAKMYATCSMNYALSVPFCERFFQLAKERGFVGQITANSFMKREFGKKLIQEFLPNVNLDLIVNTSGAYIPGHGTPTVLLFGSAESPQPAAVHTVLAKRGEPSTPKDPERGEVWTSISEHWSDPSFENDYISIARLDRQRLETHPWSLAGGGATELKKLLEERAASRLGDIIEDVGFSVILGEDEVFVRPSGRHQWQSLPRVPIVLGEDVRDWSLATPNEIVSPIDLDTLEVVANPALLRELWPWKARLESRIVSGSTSMKEAGKYWFDVRRLSRDKHKNPLSIAFAFVATHNHFVLDRGGKVFNRSAPIIKLPETATEDDHLALLAYLNSSTACFYLKQICFDKGAYSGVGKQQDDPAKVAYEFAGTLLETLPVPEFTDLLRHNLVLLANRAELHAQELEQSLTDATALESDQKPLTDRLSAAHNRYAAAERKLVFVQEQIDWMIYEAFGMATVELDTKHDESASIGARPFELLAAKNGAVLGLDGHPLHNSPPEEWPAELKQGWKTLADQISASEHLSLLEQPEFKRRWAVTPKNMGGDVIDVDERIRRLLYESVCSRLETATDWSAPTAIRESDLIRCAVSQNVEDATQLLEANCEPHALLRRICKEQSIPFLGCLRFTDTGQRKYKHWLRTWAEQRLEDEGKGRSPDTPPPRYNSKDFARTEYWRLRGKLDVPKERFIAYPGCESDEDGEPVYGWAGWDHLQRAQALAMLYQNRKTEEGWPKDRLIPILAGLYELLPWLKQWHNDQPDPTYGVLMGDYYEQFIEGERNALGLTKDQVVGWRPPKGAKRTRNKKQKHGVHS